MNSDQLRADSIAKLFQAERNSGMSTIDFWRAITRLGENTAVLKAAADRARTIVEQPK